MNLPVHCRSISVQEGMVSSLPDTIELLPQQGTPYGEALRSAAEALAIEKTPADQHLIFGSSRLALEY